MLADRDYMREPPRYSMRWSATVTLLVINIVVFVVQMISYRQFPPSTSDAMAPTDVFFALSVNGLKHGYVWQLLTFQFMHANVTHLFFNSLALFMFGRIVEDFLGKKRFLTLYFAAGIIGGLFQTLCAFLLSKYFGMVPVVGASAGICGLIAAFSLVAPNEYVFFLFVLPIRARYFLMLLLGFTTLWLVTAPKSGVAHAAHLGGILTGIVFVRYAMHWNFKWPWTQRSGQRHKRDVVKISSGKYSPWSRSEKPAEENSNPDFISREVDPILEKISAHGIHSLTERERKILDDAQKKMARR